MKRAALLTFGLVALPSLASACGLDWTLPRAHFDGVEENGYVAYWEKIGAADLGDGLVIPVHINFNSRRETSSPALGKGWMVPLLESHVEPVNENCKKVIMPDGWTFTFYRNGNTETWRGNAGWVGETKNTIFTITALCGWKIKFDEGKIQEIDSGKNRALTYRYNGGLATEVDEGGKPFVQVIGGLGNGTTTLFINGERIDVTLDRRPRVVAELNQNHITALDPSLGQLQWPGGRKETFAYGMDDELSPTLEITGVSGSDRHFVWDAGTRQIKSDGEWAYQLRAVGDHMRFDRTNSDNQTESYELDDAKGITLEKASDGPELLTYRFPSGLLNGRIRKVMEQGIKTQKTLYTASYFPNGQLMRETVFPDRTRTYAESGQLLQEMEGKTLLYLRDYDDKGRLIHMIDPGRQIETKSTFDANGAETTQVFKEGILFYTTHIDENNKLISINEGE